MRLDLRPNPADMDVDRPEISDPVMTPRVVEELPSGVGAAGMCRESREKLELLGAQVDRGAVEPQLVRHQIELEALGNWQWGARSRASLRIEHGRTFGQLCDLDRLWQRLVEAGSKGRHALGDRCRGAEMDGPEAMSSASPFAASEVELRCTCRGFGHDGNARSIVYQQVAERVRIGNRSNPGGERRQAPELGRGPVARQHQPGSARPGRSGRWRGCHRRIVGRPR